MAWLGGADLGSAISFPQIRDAGASQTEPGMRFLVEIFPRKSLQALCMQLPTLQGRGKVLSWGCVTSCSPCGAPGGKELLRKSMEWKELSMDRTGRSQPSSSFVSSILSAFTCRRNVTKFAAVLHTEEMFGSSSVVM